MLWIKTHLKIILAVLGGLSLILVGFLLNRKGAPVIQPPALPDIKNEIRAINAEAKAAKMVADLGAARAIAHVEEEHRASLQKLDDVQKQQAEQLRGDPAKLAAWLVRVGK